MPQHPDLLIVLADGEHARFVRPDRNNVLRTEWALDSLSAHRRSAELRTDRPGAAFHSDSSAHHALAPRHDPQALEQRKFAQLLADRINTAAECRDFGELIIVAPRRMLAAIRDNLDPTTASRIVGALAKDLVKISDSGLRPHVERWIGPLRRAGAR
ncbi:MAG: host attachment protein [Acetobacteraceae bacterium]